MAIRQRYLVGLIVALLFYMGVLHAQLWALHDSIAARDVDIVNCERDLAGLPAPVEYIPARASLY